MKTFTLTLPFALSAVLLAAVPSAAQVPPSRAEAARARNLEAVRRLADGLSERHGTQVLVDPALRVTNPPRTPDPKAPLAEAMRALTAQVRDSAWRRISLPRAQERLAERPGRLAAILRSLGSLPSGDLILEKPSEKRIFRLAAERERPRGWVSFDLLYSTTAKDDGREEAERLADMERQQLELRLPKERLASGAVNVLQLVAGLGKHRAEQVITPFFAAGMTLWDRTPPEERMEMLGSIMENLNAFQPGPGAGANATGRPGATPRNHLRELRGLAAELERRYQARVLVDPTLLVSAPPQAPDPALSVEDALEHLARSVSGVSWRRLYVPAGSPEPPAERAAGWVRALEANELGDLRLEDPSMGTAVTLRHEAASALAGALAGSKVERKPVYLLYSPLDPGPGAPEERLRALQQQQLETLLRLSPEQIVQRLEGQLEQFRSADPQTRAQLVSLPALAVLGGIWAPREAKERKGGK